MIRQVFSLFVLIWNAQCIGSEMSRYNPVYLSFRPHILSFKTVALNYILQIFLTYFDMFLIIIVIPFFFHYSICSHQGKMNLNLLKFFSIFNFHLLLLNTLNSYWYRDLTKLKKISSALFAFIADSAMNWIEWELQQHWFL